MASVIYLKQNKKSNTCLTRGKIMDKKVYELLNDQINKEMYSAYLYLDMSRYYNDEGLDGFSAWYKEQAEEEMEHAMKIYEYLQDNGQKIELKAIAKPDKEFASIEDPVNIAAEHERYVTSLIHAIYAAAREVNDYRTEEFLNWFVKEQCEEEKNADEMVDLVRAYASDKSALYLLNKDLKKRN